jgi:hypothetical protein
MAGLAALKLVLEVDGQGKVTGALKQVEDATASVGTTTKTVETSIGSFAVTATTATEKMARDTTSATDRMAQGTQTATGQMSSSLGDLGSAIRGVAAAYASWEIFQKAKETVMFAANVEQADRALSVIANTMGRTSEEAMKYRDSLRDLGITTNSSTNAVAQFMKAGLPLDQLNKLGRAAQGAAISYQMMTGETISSSQALDKMIRALVTGNVVELHTLGINVMQRDVLRENKLATGEAATAVDSHQRHLLMFNEVLEKTQPLMLLYEKSMDLASKQISSSKRPVEELRLALGNLFLPELTVSATLFYQTVSGGMKWVRSHTEELDAAKMVIKDFTQGLLYAVGFITAYTATMILATAATGGFAAGAGIFSGVLALLKTNLSLTGAQATITATQVGLFGESVATASSVATVGLLSVKTVFGVLSAFMLGWEIGKALSDKFEIVRKAGVYMVHGLMTGWDLAAEAYERFKATVNPFGDEEKQQAQLQSITAKYAAIKRTRDEALAGTLADAVNGTATSQAKPYQNDQAAIADGIKREQDRLAKEAAAARAAAAVEAAKDLKAAQQEADHLVTAFNQWQLNAVKSDKATDELASKIAALNLEYKQLQNTIGQTTKAGMAEALKQGVDLKQLAGYRDQIEANLRLEDATKKAKKADAEYWQGLTANWHEGKKEIDQVEQAIKQVFTLSKKGDEGPLHNFADDVHKATLAFTQAGDAFGVTAEVYVSAIEGAVAKLTGISLKELNFQNKDLAASQVGVDASTGVVTDPYAQQTAMMAARYQKEFDLIDERTNKIKEAMAAEAALGVPSLTVYSALQKQMLASTTTRTLKEKQQTIDQNKLDDESFRSRLSLVGQYTGLAGQMFSELASTQDQTSRKGFETAKLYSLGAAIMSTATAIIAQIASPDGWTPAAWARSIAAGVLGVMQITKIASTTFGGGASAPTMPSGSFGSGGATGSGAGAGVNAPYMTTKEAQNSTQLDKIAGSMDNAALALGRAADSFLSVSEMFKSTVITMLMQIAPGRFTDTSKADLTTSSGNIMNFLNLDKASVGAFFKMDVGTLWNQTMAGLFGGDKAVSGGGLTGSMTGGQFDTGSFTQYHKNGGLFGSSWDQTEYGNNVDPAFAKGMQQFFAGLKNDLMTGGAAFGISAGSTEAGFANANMPLMKVDTAGKKPEDIQKEWEAVMQAAADALAKTMPGLAALSLGGENASDTLRRLSSAVMNSNDNLALMGARLIPTTGAINDLAYNLETLMGGADAFKQKTQDYLTAILTPLQRETATAAQAQRQVNLAFQELNIAVPQTRAEFAALVDGLNTSSEEGARTFATLMDVATAFGTVQDQAAKLAETTRTYNNDLTARQLVLDLGNSDLFSLRIKQEDELKQAILDGMDTTRLQIIQNEEWAAAVNKATGVVTSSISQIVDAAKTAAMSMVDAQIAIANSMKTIMTGPLANLSPEALYNQAQAKFAALQAGPHDLAYMQALPQAATDLLNASKAYNASGKGYQDDLAKTLEAMNAALGLSGDPTLSGVETQLKVLQDIRTALTDGALITALGPTGVLAELLGAYNTETAAALQRGKEEAAAQTQAKLNDALAAVAADNALHSPEKIAALTASKALAQRDVDLSKNKESTISTSIDVYANMINAGQTFQGWTMKQMTDGITTLRANLTTQQAITAGYNSTLAGLQTQLDFAKAASLLLPGLMTNVDNLTAQLAKIIASYIIPTGTGTGTGGGETGTGTGTGGGGTGTGTGTGGGTGSSEYDRGSYWYNNGFSSQAAMMAARGWSEDDYWENIGGSGYSYAKGSAFIPFDQTADIHYGEAVVDYPSMSVLRKYGIPITNAAADNKDLVDEVKGLRAEVKALVKVNQAGHLRNAAANERTADATESTQKIKRFAGTA